MKELSQNPLFYLSLVLAGALVFQMYGIAFAVYGPPPGPPPAGNPAQPIDTSGLEQSKTGNLRLGGNADGVSWKLGVSGNLIQRDGTVKLAADNSGVVIIGEPAGTPPAGTRLNVAGNTNVGNLTVSGGNLSVSGSAQVSGDVGVVGAVNAGNLAVSGTADFNTISISGTSIPIILGGGFQLYDSETSNYIGCSYRWGAITEDFNSGACVCAAGRLQQLERYRGNSGYEGMVFCMRP